ncbi:RHS repeat-associated core domain-containing protein [Comamonas testosteroni]
MSSAHQPGNWVYNQNNQMVRYPDKTPFSQNLAVDTQVSYTAQGHTQKESNSQGAKTYSYNAAERLVNYESNDGTQAEYRYDPFGRRIAKTTKQGANSPADTTYFIYTEQALMGELDKDGKLQRAYGFNPVAGQKGLWSTDPIWQADAVNGSLTRAEVGYHYLHTDHLGTPMLATDKTGVVTWAAIGEVFGVVKFISNDTEMNLRFSGQYWDGEKNSSYNFHRDYKTSQGRYLQEDPIGMKGGINLYNYVGGNSNKYMDPLGLSEVTGEWIKAPQINITGYGIDGWNFVSPTWSWWGYIKFIRIYAHADGYINIDVKCQEKDDCGVRNWNINKKIPLHEKAHTDVGPNAYAIGVGIATTGFVGLAANILLTGTAILEAGAAALTELNKKAGANLALVTSQGPSAICKGSVPGI